MRTVTRINVVRLSTPNSLEVFMKSAIRLFSAAAVLGCLTYSAQAALVIVGGNTIFDAGGFEAGTVGNALGANDPTTGTWATVSGGGTALVVDQALTGVPAFEGDKFLKLEGGASPVRPGVTSNNVSVGDPGDLQIIEFMLRIVHAGDDNASLMVRVNQANSAGTGGGGTPVRPWFYADGTIQVRPVDGGSGSQAPINLTHNVGQWNHVILSYAIGADFYDITVNGVTETVNAYWITGDFKNGKFRSVNFRGDDTGYLIAYIDAIPEPASLALIGLGGLLMLRRRRIA